MEFPGYASTRRPETVYVLSGEPRGVESFRKEALLYYPIKSLPSPDSQYPGVFLRHSPRAPSGQRVFPLRLPANQCLIEYPHGRFVSLSVLLIGRCSDSPHDLEVQLVSTVGMAGRKFGEARPVE